MRCRWRILLMDDDESWRRALARAIRLAGYDVETHACADDLDLAATEWDSICLVLDVDLPGTRGADFRRSLHANGQDPPTIFITALDRDDTEAELTVLSPVAVLYKPFPSAELLAAIDRACRAS